MARNLLGPKADSDDPSKGYVGRDHGSVGAGFPQSSDPIELTVVMPCLNEAETVGVCIEKALGFIERSGIAGEVIIADNGSTDGSQEIAERLGARVVDVPMRGYGAALQGGIRAARGKFIIMGDSDDSYDFSRLDAFVERLRAGEELVMGNRFRGGIAPGAMPNLHRYVGNPFLTTLGRVLFRAPIRDSQCGLRGFSREAILGIGLRGTGMEFASEMVVKSTLHGLRIAEVPTTLSPDGRTRPPHLRSWRDGSRILRFHLLHSPRWLFFLPGVFLVGLGIALLEGVGALGATSGPDVWQSGLSRTGLAGALSVVLGVQAFIFGLIARRFSVRFGVLPPPGSAPGEDQGPGAWILERAALLGILLMVAGVMTIALTAGAAETAPGLLLAAGVAVLAGFELILASLIDCLFDLGRD